MRLHLTVQRHGLPVSRILWTTSPPSLFGHNLRSPSSVLPATSSAVTSSRMPNALYANGGYSIAQLLEDVNEVIPLETEQQLFDDESSGQWGLEDYVVEVGGSECLHFMEVEGLLRDGDEVLIRALQIDDLRARRISGRHQISNDGKHLIDGIPFGKPFLKRPTSSRPAITIPPRKKRRTTLTMWGGGSNYEEEDTEWAPRQHIGTGKELSLLRPESELEREDEDGDEFVDAYQDDYEDFHEPNEDGDGTVIRHNIDKTSEASESNSVASDIGEELEGLKEDMDIAAVPELETSDVKAPRRGYSLRSRPSILQPAPRKSSLSRRSTGETSRRESKSVTFDKQKQQLPVAKPEATPRAGSTSEELEGAASSDSDSSASDSSASESSDDDSSSDESESGSAATSDSSSDSGDDSSSESSASESESEQEEAPKATTVRKTSLPTNPPGAGSERTRKSNQRSKLRRRLTKLKELGFLEEDADFDALREWDSSNGGSSTGNGAAKTLRQREQEDFEAKRQKLLRDLESGGVDVSYMSEKENIRPSSAVPDTSELDDQDEQYETANDTAQATPEVTKQRRSLDVASTRRLLFGSLGVRTPRSKAEEEATRKKLAGKFRESTHQQAEQPPAEPQESEPEVDWREKLILGATECVFDDIELSTPPFPFQQRWDEEAGYIIQQRKGRNKKRKRRQQQPQVYDEEVDVNGDYYGDDDMQLNYDDAEQPGEMDETTTRMAEDTEDDLPELPSDASSLPGLAEKDLKPGLVLAFKQLDVSKETNWQPMVSDYRIAVVSDVFENNILNIQLAKAYRRQPKDEDAEEGPFKYSGFEMPGMDDEGEDDGFREVPFDDLIEPKLLRAAPAADAGDQDTASIFPADDEQPAQESSQSVIDASTASDAHENGQLVETSSQQPTSPNHDHSPVSDHSREESPVRSPRFEGFEPTYSASSPLSSSSPS
ncbi:uncharacterized protein APUU_31568A [Aspergillus puulaauensis]|uniref:DUF7357 domain-containing protein n=1 Tax=Aspergillus puulaauensis TaxID=1220207 RepID=A0A7R7XM17_9EURO|nr:uncharacterized protein APUU_31568A [Aspergillus puulaauensis]BCS23343.1 hypothetical protein APUU_31568A [Aspergillus puulaauensis]